MLLWASAADQIDADNGERERESGSERVWAGGRLQLAEKVCNRDSLDVQTVHPVELFPVEVLHLEYRNHTVIVKVAASEPKLDARICSLVFFGETKICTTQVR
eukprot:COSAG06_NODE_1073_length_10819_cov_4.311847_14_plen_103_part_00